LLKGILKRVPLTDLRANSGILGQLMDSFLKVTISHPNLGGEHMKNGCPQMLVSIEKDANQPSTSLSQG